MFVFRCMEIYELVYEFIWVNFQPVLSYRYLNIIANNEHIVMWLFAISCSPVSLLTIENKMTLHNCVITKGFSFREWKLGLVHTAHS